MLALLHLASFFPPWVDEEPFLVTGLALGAVLRWARVERLSAALLLALGVGAGCVALDAGPPAHLAHHGHHRTSHADAGARVASAGAVDVGAGAARPAATPADSGALAAAAHASREFGPQALASGDSAVADVVGGRASIARSASSGSSQHRDGGGTAGAVSAPEASAAGEAAPVTPSSGNSAAAEREFSPG